MSFDLQISNGDLIINGGQLQTVVDAQKLTQDILKICLTDIGSNHLHPGYGSFLSRSVVGNAAQTSVIAQIATSQINSCLTGLRRLQQLQLKTFQQVTADEQLAAITGISVLRSTSDPRLFTVRIAVLTKGFKPISTSFSVNPI